MSNDRARRIRDQVLRIAKSQGASPAQMGRVTEPPDTFDNSAKVRVGTKVVKAHYAGQVPNVGERVVVMRDGATWMLLVTVPEAALPNSSGSISLPTELNSALISTMGFWGHSYVDTLGRPDMGGFQIANRLFSLLGISEPLARNYGAGGTTITGDWKRMFRTARPAQDNSGDITWQAKFGPQCFLYGANDVGQHGDPTFESSRFLNDWRRCWRGVLSWFRAGAIYYPDFIYGGSGGSLGFLSGTNVGTQAAWDSIYPGGKAGVTYTGTWTQTTGDNYVSVGRNAYVTTATSGATIAVRLPPNFPGTPVTLYFGAEVGQTGSTSATVTHGGDTPASPVSLITNDRVRTPAVYSYTSTPVPSLHPIRIVGIPAGNKTTSQTITVNAGTLAAGHKLTFLGWSIEAMHPPLLTVGNIPPAGSWASGLLNTGGLAGNTDGSVLHWASYPQSNSVQSVGGGPAYNGGIRNGAHDADGWCRNSYNPALVAVAGEFAPVGSVTIADLATVADGSVMSQLYSPNDLGGTDPLHPNTEGKAVIAKEFLTAMNRVLVDPLNLMSPFDAGDFAEALGSYSS